MFEIKNIFSPIFDLIMTEAKHQKMVKRKIIKIDEDLCTGCGNCVVDCAEGALKVIDGKARVINEVFCDGLGACISGCPEGALEIIEREALEFDEEAVEKHLESMKYIEEVETEQINQLVNEHTHQCGCPSAQTMVFEKSEAQTEVSGKIASALRQWPVQMHLVSPMAPYFQRADVVLAADCVSYALADFHKDYLKGKKLAIACPKLDSDQEIYIEKIKALFDLAKINTLTVMIMQVPCCRGLLQVALEGARQTERKAPVKLIIVGIKGEVLQEEWASV